MKKNLLYNFYMRFFIKFLKIFFFYDDLSVLIFRVKLFISKIKILPNEIISRHSIEFLNDHFILENTIESTNLRCSKNVAGKFKKNSHELSIL